MSDEVVMQKAFAYAASHDLLLMDRLGFGVHGIILAAEDKSGGGPVAIKAHREREPYLRERDAYERLRAAGVVEILGFNVPQYQRSDDALGVIEMTIVTRPFVLDFAGAYLDQLPTFPDEAWAAWEAEKSDQFDFHWATVRRVLDSLEELDIYMVDVSPSNIAFDD